MKSSVDEDIVGNLSIFLKLFGDVRSTIIYAEEVCE